jgi:site-specific DNA recombinase
LNARTPTGHNVIQRSDPKPSFSYVCQSKPIRQDYLDGIIWQQVVELLEDPALIRQEIQRRLQDIQDSDSTKKRKEVIDSQTIT